MDEKLVHNLTGDAISLLKELVKIPSFSREESLAAGCMVKFLEDRNILTNREGNNTWAVNKYADPLKPTILLNSHIDTVKPNSGYTLDPFNPGTRDGKLFGLGSTDAGASLVSLAAAFIYFYGEKDMPYNMLFAATAEEEVSGANGVESLFGMPAFNRYFQHCNSFAVVGEPTQLELAIAEKGLLVIDCTINGTAGHAAREEGDNAIYKAMEAINWFRNYRFEKTSELLGEVKMTVTSIQTGDKSHNIVPAQCSFVVDIRIPDSYTHEEILTVIKNAIPAEIKARGMRLRSSLIPVDHPVVQAGIFVGKKTFGSPTLSDKALIPLPSLKCGPGNSAQSHSADEFVLLKDIEDGIKLYINLMEKLTHKPITPDEIMAEKY